METGNRDPYGGLLIWVVVTIGFLLAAALWAWPHVPAGAKYAFFFGVFVAMYAVATGFALLSRAHDAARRRRRR
ncbi:hypothetical protein GCM10009557_39200 [Virgisporangium ochraceum]|uniref:Uncharacterized protein n=1 Tax=Virgisporangium ochraceum TaxID=65505 RepID=A0A8J4A2W1_9ACTN|nr:hypothetical protein [Virgisporangium ochraceum]GIJ74749.1 hypothetical protein Voc01_096660 [Virgisporangium ochraceum]